MDSKSDSRVSGKYLVAGGPELVSYKNSSEAEGISMHLFSKRGCQKGKMGAICTNFKARKTSVLCHHATQSNQRKLQSERSRPETFQTQVMISSVRFCLWLYFFSLRDDRISGFWLAAQRILISLTLCCYLFLSIRFSVLISFTLCCYLFLSTRFSVVRS